MKTNPIIGKTITALEIAEDKQALRFVLADNAECIVNADGDCCSYTWIEHIELPALGFPALVVSVEDIAMPDLGEMEGRDVVAYYGCKIVTDRGEIIIDFRNDSNGYYGGDLSWPDDTYYYGGVFGQNKSNHQWQPVTGAATSGVQS